MSRNHPLKDWLIVSLQKLTELINANEAGLDMSAPAGRIVAELTINDENGIDAHVMVYQVDQMGGSDGDG